MPDGSPYYLHWPRSEFHKAMGIKEQVKHPDGSVSRVVPAGGIPVNMLLDFLPTMQGKDFDLVIEQIEMEEQMQNGDFDQLIKEGKKFRYGLSNGSYRPSVKPETEMS